MLLKNLILLISILLLFSCKDDPDYSGTFFLSEGPCTNEYIYMKKVAGFGDKYYIVKPYRKNQNPEGVKEFLGVIKGDKIRIDGSTISVGSGRLVIKARDKRCIYKR